MLSTEGRAVGGAGAVAELLTRVCSQPLCQAEEGGFGSAKLQARGQAGIREKSFFASYER